jgi:gamma-glutamyl:cysteine ligase YbdK (ATP-grasp superfamily)
VADRLLREPDGRAVSEIELGDVAWSNELVLHVIELKTNGPSPSFDPLPARFQQHVGRVNERLAPLQGRLMPTGMHPWMDPDRETRLWPHEYSSVYRAYDRIFNCRGHGWANLQAAHLNLPFADDDEFGRLHAAIRLVLPILPALAASSPVANSWITGRLDTRLEWYRTNATRLPSITGDVIPEPVFTRSDYERQILQRMYDDIREHDAAGVLRHEFLNSRGAIPRFDRGAIEIRLLDMQECPAADVAVCGAIARVLQALVDQRWCDLKAQQRFDSERLVRILLDGVRRADRGLIGDRGFLDHLGYPSAARSCTAAELWHHLCSATVWSDDSRPAWSDPLRTILRRGPLARRILHRLGRDPRPTKLRTVYGELCDCLAEGRMFE